MSDALRMGHYYSSAASMGEWAHTSSKNGRLEISFSIVSMFGAGAANGREEGKRNASSCQKTIHVVLRERQICAWVTHSLWPNVLTDLISNNHFRCYWYLAMCCVFGRYRPFVIIVVNEVCMSVCFIRFGLAWFGYETHTNHKQDYIFRHRRLGNGDRHRRWLAATWEECVNEPINRHWENSVRFVFGVVVRWKGQTYSKGNVYIHSIWKIYELMKLIYISDGKKVNKLESCECHCSLFWQKHIRIAMS